MKAIMKSRLLFFFFMSMYVNAHEMEFMKLIKNDHEIPKSLAQIFVQKVAQAEKARSKRNKYCSYLESKRLFKLDMSQFEKLSYREAEDAIMAKKMANNYECNKNANDRFNLSMLNIILYKKHLFMDYQPELKVFLETAFPTLERDFHLSRIRKDVRTYLDKVIGEEPFDDLKTIQNSIMPKQTDINTSTPAAPSPKPAQR